MERPVLEIEARSVLGKKVKRLRADGLVPGIVYGHDTEPTPVQVPAQDFEKLYRRAGSNTIVKLALDDKDRNVLVHEPDVDPVSGKLLHVDFYQVDMTEKIKAEVPLHFVGDSPAVREMDGTLVTNRDTVEVECLPADLPHNFELELAALVDFEVQLKVQDIGTSSAVTILTDPEEVIAYVEEPRSEEELAALEEAPAEAETPEVIGAEGPPAGGEGGEKIEAEAGQEAGGAETAAESTETPKGSEKSDK